MVRTARAVLAWMASSILVLGESASAADRALPTLQPGVLRIGTYFVNPPFEYRSGGRHVGFEVELMTEVARRLGNPLCTHDQPWLATDVLPLLTRDGVGVTAVSSKPASRQESVR